MMGRRMLLAAALALTAPVRAQERPLPVIGFLNSFSPETVAPLLEGFHAGLTAAGYLAGRNVEIEYRWAEGRYDRLPALAAELVRRNVAVIVAGGGSPSPLAARAATATIPVVFVSGSDPVALGLVPNLNRPGGNLTGVTMQNSSLDLKRLELLHELLPQADPITALLNPANNVFALQSRDLAEAARLLGLRLRILTASSVPEIDAAFATMAGEGTEALLLGVDAFFTQNRLQQIAALVARHRIPAISGAREWSDAGLLMSYGSDAAAAYRQAGLHVGRILDGASPADLPVVQLMTFHFAINLRTAAALGITIPPAILLRATELIE